MNANENPVVLSVAGVGEVEITLHALDRMEQRGVTREAIAERLLSDPRKFLAVKRLTTERVVRLTLGRLTFALVSIETRLRVLSVWWRVSHDGRTPMQ